MVCHAIGRCRICARRHKLPVFGSEENQHALIEKVNLQLIVLNTICADCIEKFEQVVKGKESHAGYTSSVCKPEATDSHKSCNNSIAQQVEIGAIPTMHFYVESNENTPTNSSPSSVTENERLSPIENSSSSEKTVTHQPQKLHNTQTLQTDSSPNRNKENLKTSTKVRTKRKSPSLLNCDFCEKEFTHRGDLKRHKRKHTGEKPYECSECKKKFSQLSNLSRHQLVHSGERPFACAQCGQRYSRKGRLANHIGRQLCRRKRLLPGRLSQTWKE